MVGIMMPTTLEAPQITTFLRPTHQVLPICLQQGPCMSPSSKFAAGEQWKSRARSIKPYNTKPQSYKA